MGVDLEWVRLRSLDTGEAEVFFRADGLIAYLAGVGVPVGITQELAIAVSEIEERGAKQA